MSPTAKLRPQDPTCDNDDALRRCATLLAIALIVTLWTSALIAAPSSGAPRFSAVVYTAGSLVCHQRPERSFHRDGAQYPVCARCLGLYLGGVAGALGWIAIAGVGVLPRRRASRAATQDLRRALVITAIPTVVTVLTGMIGWWDPSNNLRALLAVPFGATIAAVVAAVAAGDMR